MKVIDLLNKIANKEKVPDGIKWGCHDFIWFVYEYRSNELGEPTLLDYLSRCPHMLNDEIITFNKIEKNNKIEKIQALGSQWYSENIGEYIDNEDSYTAYDEYLMNKINEIIDTINELKGSDEE